MQNAPPPDVDGLISGGPGPPAPPQHGADRRRRRGRGRARRRGCVRRHAGRSRRSGPDSSRPSRPSRPSPRRPRRPSRTTADSRSSPARYRMFVGVDAAGVTIQADLTIEGPGWTAGTIRCVSEGATSAGVGCLPARLRWPPGPVAPATSRTGTSGKTPQALARQLARLPRSTVVQPPTPTEAFGHDAIHLRLRIDDDCPVDRGLPRCRERREGVAASPTATAPRTVVIDFWVVDLDGAPVVVDMWHQVDASSELVDRATQVRDSITFVPRD